MVVLCVQALQAQQEAQTQDQKAYWAEMKQLMAAYHERQAAARQVEEEVALELAEQQRQEVCVAQGDTGYCINHCHCSANLPPCGRVAFQ